MEAGGAGGVRVPPRQNRRDRCLLNTPPESGRQDREGETVSRGAVVRGHGYRTEWGSMETYGVFPFLGTVPGCDESVRAYSSFQAGFLMSLFAYRWVVAMASLALITVSLLNLLPKSSLHKRREGHLDSTLKTLDQVSLTAFFLRPSV